MEKMNGMIFAAGLGTRLRSLTQDRPKALVEVNGKTLLQQVVERMKAAGIRRIVVNVHHFADQIERYLEANNGFGIEILISDERAELLDTGGGLARAASLFVPGQPVLVHNVDIASDVDLEQLGAEHFRQGAYATLVVQPGGGGRVLRFDGECILKGWENKATGEQKVVDDAFYTSGDYSYCGIQVLSPGYWNHFHHQGVFSIIDEHLFQAREHRIHAWQHSGFCRDLGTPEDLQEWGAQQKPEA